MESKKTRADFLNHIYEKTKNRENSIFFDGYLIVFVNGNTCVCKQQLQTFTNLINYYLLFFLL